MSRACTAGAAAPLSLIFSQRAISRAGVISSNSNYVEHSELVSQRILRYANLVGRERVVAGRDCGFGTFAGFGPVYPPFCWMKLRALADGARRASGKLWGQ